MDPSYIEENAEQLLRMRALVERLDDDALRTQVNEHWTVAGILGHVAFWDARVLALADKLERGEPFTPSEEEPEDPGGLTTRLAPRSMPSHPKSWPPSRCGLRRRPTGAWLRSRPVGCGRTTRRAR